MCSVVISGTTTASTPRELAELLGDEDVLAWEHHEGHMDWCLCSINVPETLHRAGRSWVVPIEQTYQLD